MKKSLLIFALLFFCGSISAQKQYKAYMVSNAHFDTQWNWDVQTSINDYLKKTLDQNIWLIANYPDYVFNFEGGIKYFWMKEYYPEQYEIVKELVKAKRWNVTGSTWDANDPNMPSSESFFRNILLGQHFYMDEFGVKGNDIFLPDCFGFGNTLPTIAAHSGLIGFSTQKLQWRQKPFYGDSKVPFNIGLWEGLDGSRIMAALNAQGYTKSYNDTDISHDEELVKLASDGVDNIAYRYYGTGDTGGSPTIRSVMAIERGLKGDGPVQIISARSGELYDDFYPFSNHPELPVHVGELLMDVHATGCYTSQAAMKRFNRRNEQLADLAERSSVVADWLGGYEYPADELRESWCRFIWHQFHDDLTGTSIPKAYTFSWNDELISQSQFANAATTAVGAVARALDTRVSGTPVIVYNVMSQPRKDLVEATVDMAVRPAGVVATDSNGKSVPAQLLSWEEGKAKVLFAANVDPVSFSVYSVAAGRPASAKALRSTANSIENAAYKVTFDANGDISSMKDKRNGNKEMVESGKAFRLALFTENESFSWPAWEIIKGTMDATPVAIDGNVKMTVVENGPLRVTMKVERTCNNSKFVQYVSLTDGAADDRLDILNEFDWDETNALLKAEFPMSVANKNATYDVGLGFVERDNNTETEYEVVAQQWADLTASDGSYGVAVMNDCKYGWDKPGDNTIRLTLLHTPKTNRGYAYQDQQDKGHHTIRYSIVGHKSTPADARVAWKAEALNQPLVSFNTPKHAGTLGRKFSFVKTSTPQIFIKALKEAEDGGSYVVRISEIDGKPYSNAEIIFSAAIESASELNGNEDVIGQARVSGNKLIFSGTAFQPKTFSVKLKKNASLAPANNTFVELAHTATAVTTDVFARSGNFDSGRSFAAEILPSTILSDGVEFKVNNDPTDLNYMRCAGQEIKLPAGNAGKKLYLLVTAVRQDRNATFKVDGKDYNFNVPLWTDFYGQWGHTGNTEGFVKDGSLAYVGTHRHGRQGNDAYMFSYLYKIAIPLTGEASTLTLPNDPMVALFAVTVSDNANADTVPAMEMRAMPFETTPVAYSNEVPDPSRFRRP